MAYGYRRKHPAANVTQGIANAIIPYLERIRAEKEAQAQQEAEERIINMQMIAKNPEWFGEGQFQDYGLPMPEQLMEQRKEESKLKRKGEKKALKYLRKKNLDPESMAEFMETPEYDALVEQMGKLQDVKKGEIGQIKTQQEIDIAAGEERRKQEAHDLMKESFERYGTFKGKHTPRTPPKDPDVIDYPEIKQDAQEWIANQALMSPTGELDPRAAIAGQPMPEVIQGTTAMDTLQAVAEYIALMDRLNRGYTVRHLLPWQEEEVKRRKGKPTKEKKGKGLKPSTIPDEALPEAIINELMGY
jgi:hypothetical protein